jgi:hypothetical protein
MFRQDSKSSNKLSLNTWRIYLSQRCYRNELNSNLIRYILKSIQICITCYIRWKRINKLCIPPTYKSSAQIQYIRWTGSRNNLWETILITNTSFTNTFFHNLGFFQDFPFKFIPCLITKYFFFWKHTLHQKYRSSFISDTYSNPL